MKTPPDNTSLLIENLFRHESGKLIAVLTRVFGTENLELSEDVVQDTFISAMRVWRLKGLPDNPSAWLFRSAKNKAIDIIRRNKFSTQFDFSDPEKTLLKSEYTLNTTMDKLWDEDLIQDDLLRMMFACCHDDISRENQITLILKTLCGFSTAEIAKAFLTSEDAISKRLYRTKAFFRDHKIKPQFPAKNQIKSRTDAVLKTIYLLFNEGYSSTHTDQFIRKDLIDQAMYLCGLLCNNSHIELPEANAAMALMYFHAARVESRISPAGDIVLLPEQDRSKWNQKFFELGNEYMNKAAVGQKPSSYHFEAAIAYEHCIAETFEKTNWPQILTYYNLLAEINPTSIVMLNRLAVIFKLHGSKAALKEIESSTYRESWDKNHLYYSLLGDIYATENKEKAKASYEKAILLTQSESEKTLLRRKITRL